MKQVFKKGKKEITIYTEGHVLEAMSQVMLIPSDSYIMAQLCGKRVSGTPADIIGQFQSLLYALARKDGFEGIEECEEEFGNDIWNL